MFGADANVPPRLIAEVSRGGRIGDFEVNDRIAALTALRQAELYAGYDQEEACQNALNTARQHLGMY